MKINVSRNQIEDFLREVDSLFPVPISSKTDLGNYAKKITESADVFACISEGRIISMTAGYISNAYDKQGYISIVATLPQYQGKGIGGKLVREFVDEARAHGLASVHVYAVESNTPAVQMYLRNGFQRWHSNNEPRPKDLHLRIAF